MINWELSKRSKFGLADNCYKLKPQSVQEKAKMYHLKPNQVTRSVLIIKRKV